jgi:hypothetical protein
MPSWTAVDMVREIENIGKLWKARGVSKVVETMVANAERKLKTLSSLEANDAIQLYMAIDSANLDSALKSKLSEAVDVLITEETGSDGSTSSAGSGSQKLLTPFNYLTAGDWQQIDKDGTSYWTIIYVMVERFKKMASSLLWLSALASGQWPHWWRIIWRGQASCHRTMPFTSCRRI